MVALSFGLLWIHLKGFVAQTYLLVAIILWALEVRNAPSPRLKWFGILGIAYICRSGSRALSSSCIATVVEDVQPLPLKLCQEMH